MAESDEKICATSSEQGTQASSELARLIHGHPIVDMTSSLGTLMGLGADIITLTTLLSRVSARIGRPFNLAIYADDSGAERIIANRVAGVDLERVRYLTTLRELDKLASNHFENADLLIVPGGHDRLFKHACETTCREIEDIPCPTVWQINDHRTKSPAIGPTLSMLAMQASRSLVGFGHNFSKAFSIESGRAKSELRHFLSLVEGFCPTCHFNDRFRAHIRLSDSLIFYRFLQSVAAVRIAASTMRINECLDDDSRITFDDYRVARTLLNVLPVAPVASALSPAAAETGELLYEHVNADSYEQTVPDQSTFGNKVFTRTTGSSVTGLSHNGIKKHIEELDAEGIIETLPVHGINKFARIRGAKTHYFYRFTGRFAPPFGVVNPFQRLPTVEQISTNCTQAVQLKSKEVP